MGKMIVNIERQSGKKPNIPADQQIMAMYPGKRISADGNIYWETRKNRSDLNKKKRL
jgi:hypothetical protein